MNALFLLTWNITHSVRTSGTHILVLVWWIIQSAGIDGITPFLLLVTNAIINSFVEAGAETETQTEVSTE
jgi:hypothetical protein